MGTSLVLEVEVSSDEEDDFSELPEGQNVFKVIDSIESAASSAPTDRITLLSKTHFQLNAFKQIKFSDKQAKKLLFGVKKPDREPIRNYHEIHPDSKRIKKPKKRPTLAKQTNTVKMTYEIVNK